MLSSRFTLMVIPQRSRRCHCDAATLSAFLPRSLYGKEFYVTLSLRSYCASSKRALLHVCFEQVQNKCGGQPLMPFHAVSKVLVLRFDVLMMCSRISCYDHSRSWLFLGSFRHRIDIFAQWNGGITATICEYLCEYLST